MPAHLHILLRITERSPKALGYYISNLTGAIRREWKAITGYEYPLFEKGYNDRIIHPQRSLDAIFRYIRENPHRLAARKMYPTFFRRVYNIIISGKSYQSYGNQFLLRNPFKEQVIVHRSDDEDTRRRMRALWHYTAVNGGVLVSPFISPAEKVIRDEAIQAGGRIIHITHTPFPDRYKPNASEFDLCCQGRLLILAPTVPTSIVTSSSDTISRAQCLDMNTLAAYICAEGA